MKPFFLLPALLLVTICHAQLIQPGDNIFDAIKQIKTPHYFEAPKLSEWKEAQDLILIGEKPDALTNQFLFVATHDTTLFAVFSTGAPNYFMFDTEGDSILRDKTGSFILPSWIVKQRTNVSSGDTKALTLLEKLYATTMQADDLDSVANRSNFQQYQQFKVDASLSNRHILCILDDYQTLVADGYAANIKQPSDLCIAIIGRLSNECLQLYNQIPAIVCIYMGEALLSAGMDDKARAHFQMSSQFYPNSIPLQVYNYRLEKDPAKKKAALVKLKKEHPRHWMVKDL